MRQAAAQAAPSGALAVALSQLVGKTVVQVETKPPAFDLTIQWSNGLSLVVFGDSTPDRDDAWFIIGTDSEEIAGTPVRRR